MSKTNDRPNLPWQAMQRRLAERGRAVTDGYPTVRKAMQPQWKMTPQSVSWLSKTRSGVLRGRVIA